MTAILELARRLLGDRDTADDVRVLAEALLQFAADRRAAGDRLESALAENRKLEVALELCRRDVAENPRLRAALWACLEQYETFYGPQPHGPLYGRICVALRIDPDPARRQPAGGAP